MQEQRRHRRGLIGSMSQRKGDDVIGASRSCLVESREGEPAQTPPTETDMARPRQGGGATRTPLSQPAAACRDVAGLLPSPLAVGT
jgi:hypothetical protein